MGRKKEIDNIRWITVLLVVLYHVIYIYNSVGVISNFSVQGIPQLDGYLYFVYPWFMALLFVVAGISARFSLQKRGNKGFIKDRAKRLLLPSVVGMFLFGWISGWVTSQYADIFGETQIPGLMKYLIYCICGIGPLWFAQELFLACVILLLLCKIDRKDILSRMGQRTNWAGILILALPFWGSSLILNTPVIEVYRNGFYIFSFLLGYYVFAHEEVMERLRKRKLPLLLAACICGIVYTVYYFGENYAAMGVLKHPFTNGYAYLMVLAILACAKDFLAFDTPVSRYMTKANFAYYILHYPLLSIVAYVTNTYFDLPMLCQYLINLILVLVLLPLVYEGFRRLPLLRMFT